MAYTLIYILQLGAVIIHPISWYIRKLHIQVCFIVRYADNKASQDSQRIFTLYTLNSCQSTTRCDLYIYI